MSESQEIHDDPTGPGGVASGESNVSILSSGNSNLQPLGESRPLETTETPRRLPIKYKYMDIPMKDYALSDRTELPKVDPEQIRQSAWEWFLKLKESQPTIDWNKALETSTTEAEARLLVSELIAKNIKPLTQEIPDKSTGMMEKWLSDPSQWGAGDEIGGVKGRKLPLGEDRYFTSDDRIGFTKLPDGFQQEGESRVQALERYKRSLVEMFNTIENSSSHELEPRDWKLEQTITAQDESGVGYTHFAKISEPNGKSLYVTFGSTLEDPSGSTIVPEMITKGDATIAEMDEEQRLIGSHEKALLRKMRFDGLMDIRIGAINTMGDVKNLVYNESTTDKKLIINAPVTMNQLRYELEYTLADRKRKPETDAYRIGKALLQSKNKSAGT